MVLISASQNELQHPEPIKELLQFLPHNKTSQILFGWRLKQTRLLMGIGALNLIGFNCVSKGYLLVLKKKRLQTCCFRTTCDSNRNKWET